MMSDQLPRLFIGGLRADITKGDMHKELSKLGRIVDLWIARNPPGFAFVQFDSYSDMEKAIDVLDGSNVFGSKVKVEFAKIGSQKESRSRSSARRGKSRNGGSSPSRRYGSPPPSHRPYENYYPEAFSAAPAASFPFHPAAYPNGIPTPSVPYLNEPYRNIQGSRCSPSYRRRSRSPIGYGRRGSYDRYRDDREARGSSPYRRGRRSGSRDRGRLSPMPPPPPFRRERSPPYRRGGPPPVSYEQYPFPVPPSGDVMGMGGRFHYDRRSPPSFGAPDRRGRRY